MASIDPVDRSGHVAEGVEHAGPVELEGRSVVPADRVSPVVRLGQRGLGLAQPLEGKPAVADQGGAMSLLPSEEGSQPGTRLRCRFCRRVGELESFVRVLQVGGLQRHAPQRPAVGDFVAACFGQPEGLPVVALSETVRLLVHGHPPREVHEIARGGAHVVLDGFASVCPQVGGYRVDDERGGHRACVRPSEFVEDVRDLFGHAPHHGDVTGADPDRSPRCLMFEPVKSLVGFAEARHHESGGIERGREDRSARWVHVCPSGVDQTLNGVQRRLGDNVRSGHDG
jgi:hypothetical protein